MESLQISNLQTSLSGNITASKCAKGQALISYNDDEKEIIFKKIKSATAKMFFFHCGGQKPNAFDIDRNELFTETLIEIYEYETPQTILLFLKKAANGDFGKFFGNPDIGTIREWFADFLMQTIIPEREKLHTSKKEIKPIGEEKSLREIIQGDKVLRKI